MLNKSIAAQTRFVRGQSLAAISAASQHTSLADSFASLFTDKAFKLHLSLAIIVRL